MTNDVRLIRSDRGFTLQETLIVLIVASLLLDFCFSLFLFSGKLFTLWQKKSETELAVNRISQMIINDVQCSKDIVEITGSSFVLVSGINSTVRYTHSAVSLWRNDVEIILPEGAVLRLTVAPVEELKTIIAVEAVLQTKDREFRSAIQIKLNQAAMQQFNTKPA